MRISLFAVAATLAASLAPPRVNAQTAETKAGPTTYLVIVDGASVAILPSDLGYKIDVSCSGDATRDKVTGAMIFSREVKLIASVSGRAAITITGDSVTLLPQK